MILPVMACVALHAWDSSYSYEFNFVVLPMKNMTPSPPQKKKRLSQLPFIGSCFMYISQY
jgi:hypothetical protein